jgi:hypothetical protein
MRQRARHALPCSLALMLAASANAAPLSDQPAQTLWSQNDRPSTYSLHSQDMEAMFDAYDCQGADDFVVPGNVVWTVGRLEVTGDFGQGTGDGLRAHNIVFYEDAGGLPGAPVKEYAVLGERFGLGSFLFKLPEPVKLRAGRYWVSVQADMDWIQGGFWNWAFRKERRGSHSVWKNPPDGYGTGCTDYQSTKICLDPPEDGSHWGPDFMFALYGKSLRR